MAVHVSSKSDFFSEMANQIREIKAHPDSPDLPIKIRTLADQIEAYLQNVKLKDCRCEFFVFERMYPVNLFKILTLY